MLIVLVLAVGDDVDDVDDVGCGITGAAGLVTFPVGMSAATLVGTLPSLY